MEAKSNIQHNQTATMTQEEEQSIRLRRSAGPWVRAWRRFRANKLALVALTILALLIILAICAPLVSRYITHKSPSDQRLLSKYAPISTTYLLGGDEYGRDVLTRMAYGGRVSLGVAFLGVAVALLVGVSVGAIAAYYGGAVDALLMRFVDLMLSIPSLFLLILIGSLVRVEPTMLALIIALLSWFGLSRLVRSEILTIKHREYVEAARVIGAPDWMILGRHIIPNILHIIIVWATVAVPGFIISEAVLSYLGLGIQAPTPSWGNMLSASTQYFYKAKNLVIIPGFFITITVLALNIIGNALRDALDPRLNN